MAERVTKIKGRGQTDQGIIRACGYITDDKFIASYLGVDVKRVAQLRVHVNKTKAKKVSTDVPTVASINWNNDAERKWNANAREGSTALLKALEKFFEKRALGQSK